MNKLFAFLVLGTALASGQVTPYYSSSSVWNTPIPANPAIDPNSATMITASIVLGATNSAFNNGNDWGMALIQAHTGDHVYTVSCGVLTNDAPGTVSWPIPAGAISTTGLDYHLTVISIDGTQELGMAGVAYNSSNNTWSASECTPGPLLTGSGWSGTAGTYSDGPYAAGEMGMAGVIRPEEIAQGHIDHALAMVPTNVNRDYGAACPGTHFDGQSGHPTWIPEGARVQMDPTYNVDAQSWPAWQKTIAKALQKYGAFIVDQGGINVTLYGQTDQNVGNTTWASISVPKNPSLTFLPWSSMRVLKMENCVFNLQAPFIVDSPAAAPGSGQVTVSWAANVGAVSYHVKRATVSGGPYTTIASPAAGNGAPAASNYISPGLVNGTTYYYVVSAVNAAGEGPNSAQVSATPSSSGTPPAAPTGLTATVI
jgi:hypothetical protein